MKTLSILMLLITSMSFGQTKKISYSLYVPLKTMHYTVYPTYASDQGGNIGLVLTRKVTHNDVLYTDTSFGVIRNSYGDPTVLLMQGIGVDVIGLNVGLSGGFATGYEKQYQYSYKDRTDIPGIFSNNGIYGYLGVNLSLSQGIEISAKNKIDITPMILVTPVFVNGGLKVNFN